MVDIHIRDRSRDRYSAGHLLVLSMPRAPLARVNVINVLLCHDRYVEHWGINRCNSRSRDLGNTSKEIKIRDKRSSRRCWTALRQRGQGDAFWVLGDHYMFKVSSEETSGSLAVVEIVAFPQNGPPPHIHHREDESFYILDGTFSVLVGDQSFEAGAGVFVHIPKGTLHTYKNIGAKPARLLVILTPGDLENFWREIGEPAEQDSIPPAPPEGIIES